MIEKWGIECGWAITILELFSIFNLAMFAYFTAVAYEHFHLGNKDKKLLAKEAHRKEVMKAAADTQKRLKAQQKEYAQSAEIERRKTLENAKEQERIAEINNTYGNNQGNQPLLENSQRSQGVTIANSTDAPASPSVDNEHI